MTLDEFIAEERKRLIRFKEDYRRCATKWPDQYPLELGPWDWDEQMRAYCE